MQACLFLGIHYIVMRRWKSRDAKFCVSQARMRNKLRRLCACHYCGFCPGDARNAFITSISLYALYCHGLLVRRKILRLYWAGAIESVSIKSIIIPAVHQSRDAKFCVSQARIRNKHMRLCAFHCWVFLLVRRKILRLYLADAIIIINSKCLLWFSVKPK